MVGGRYRRVRRIGLGASGEVWEATDTVTGAAVALKILCPIDVASRTRVQREVRALRLLQVPGVVRLLDEGEDDGQVYIVMERVHGVPFPGPTTSRSWEDLRPRILSLFDVLARVHGLGVVHRDLKPENVLVTSDGRLVVLDFGLARGEQFDVTVTLPEALLGTVRYMSPEQFQAPTTDVRADLYSAAVMAVECLTGRLPHTATGGLPLLVERASRDPIPVRELAGNVPPHVASTLDALLHRDPEARLASADAVVAMLRGDSDPGTRPADHPPWIGPTTLIETAVARIESGVPVVIEGPPRSGRSRVLFEIAERLRAKKRAVHVLPHGRRPFSSLLALMGGKLDERDAQASMERRVEDLLGLGSVLVADDSERIDRWSLAILERRGGRFLRVGEAANALRIAELTEMDLAACFEGPERLLHIPSQAAAALMERAGGRAGRVVAELTGWERAGLCTREPRRWRMAPGAINRLAGGLAVEPVSAAASGAAIQLEPVLQDLLRWISLAWPHTATDALSAAAGVAPWEIELGLEELARQRLVRRLEDGRVRAVVPATAGEAWDPARTRAAHRALASRLSPGMIGRLRHLVAAQETADAAAEAATVAETLRVEGDPARAFVTAQLGLRLLADETQPVLRERLLTVLLRSAFAAGTARAYAEAAYEVQQATDLSRDAIRRGVGACRQLAEAAHAALVGSSDALSRCREVARLDDFELDAERMILLAHAELRHHPPDAERLAVLEAEAARSPHGERILAVIEADRHTRAGAAAAAATAHCRAAHLAPSASARARALLEAASGMLECGRHAVARVLAEMATPVARRAGAPSVEAGAEWVRRCADFRDGVSLRVDHELLDVVASLDMPRLDAQIAMNEAAVAWRAGDHDQARDLATRAAEAWRRAGFGGGEALVRALAWAAGGLPCPGLLPVQAGGAPDGLAAQTLALGLLASRRMRDPELDRVVRQALVDRLAGLADLAPGHRMEVLSVGELRAIAAPAAEHAV